MSKKLLSIFLSLILFIPLASACGTNPSGSSSEPSAESSEPMQSSGSESAPTDESDRSSEESEPIAEKDYPTLCGTFLQPGTFSTYSKAKFDRHFDYLKEVGIDILIVQWTVENNSDGASKVYFDIPDDSSFKAYCSVSGQPMMNNLLASAEEKGIKVFIGLNNDDDWWSVHVSDRNWINYQSALAVSAAECMYSQYKTLYPNAFYGWYFTFELYNFINDKTLLDNAAYLLSSYRDGLYAIDKDMPMMLSPFITSGHLTPDDTYESWKTVFENTSFREGDIFCCQDSVGAGHVTIEQLEPYFAALKKAVDTKPGLRFWANNEDFTIGFGTAEFDRFLRQLEISEKYCEEHVTFAYSHYQIPDQGKTGHHLAYKHYYENGSVPEIALKLPSLTASIDSTGLSVIIKGNLDNSSKTLFEAVVECNGEIVKRVSYESLYNRASIPFSYTDSVAGKSGVLLYTVYLVDYYGNKTEKASYEITLTESKFIEIAAGKEYISENSSPNYPDKNGSSLTDGKSGSATYADGAWVGFVGNGTVTVDLGATTDKLILFEAEFLFDSSAGVHIPTDLEVLVSNDNVNFTSICSETFPAYSSDSNGVLSRTLSAPNVVSARYVRLVFKGSGWVFLDEVKLFVKE